MAVDQTSLDELLGRFVADLGAALNATTIVLGDRLGLWRALAEGTATPADLAARTGTAERYIAEWLRGQAAGGYVSYNPVTRRYYLTPEQAFAMADPDGLGLPGAFRLAGSTIRDEAKIAAAFRSGAGLGWHEHHPDLYEGTERFVRPSYAAHLVSDWLPALDGVVDALAEGARVADVGCGYGTATIMMAQAFPNSTFVGFDYHEASITWARRAAKEAGVADRCTFEVAAATDFPGTGYRLVCTFDALHDLGDPVGAAAHIHRALAGDGTWLLVEPMAGDAVPDNLNPVGRVYYNASALICVPHSLSQEGGAALGAQAGEAVIRGVVESAGLGAFRRAAQTPFNLVYEVRP